MSRTQIDVHCYTLTQTQTPTDTHTHSLKTTNITSWDIRRRVALLLNAPDPWRPCLPSTSCLSKSSPHNGLLSISLLLASPGLNGGFECKRFSVPQMFWTEALITVCRNKSACKKKRYTKITCHCLCCAKWQVYVLPFISVVLVLLGELLHFLGHSLWEEKSDM